MSDSRQGLNKQFKLADLKRRSVKSRLAGYEDLNDDERLTADPTFRMISSRGIWVWGAALPSTLHWFETELQTREKKPLGLMVLYRETLGQVSLSTAPNPSCPTWTPARVRFPLNNGATTMMGTSSRSATTRRFCSTVKGAGRTARIELSEPRDPGGARSSGKFFEWRVGEAYGVRARGPNRKFRIYGLEIFSWSDPNGF